jgi:hypothetical protein
MATLSALAQTQLQSAIDLLVKGTAYETPLSEDVIQRIAPVIAAAGLFDPRNPNQTLTVGGVYEFAKNNPKSLLIGLVAFAGAGVLTGAQETALEEAAFLMVEGSAYESPWSEDIVQRLAAVAESTNFLTRGGFYEAIKLNPVSTMLKWALQVGSDPSTGGYACPWYAADYATATGPSDYAVYPSYAAASAAAAGFTEPVIGWGANFPNVDWHTLPSTNTVAIYYVTATLSWSWTIGSALPLDAGGAQATADDARLAIEASPSLPAGYCVN